MKIKPGKKRPSQRQKILSPASEEIYLARLSQYNTAERPLLVQANFVDARAADSAPWLEGIYGDAVVGIFATKLEFIEKQINAAGRIPQGGPFGGAIAIAN